MAVRYRSIDLEEMAAASRNWKPCRERVGKLAMSVGLLTNRRKETTMGGEHRAGEKSPGRVMKSRDSFFHANRKYSWLTKVLERRPQKALNACAFLVAS